MQYSQIRGESNLWRFLCNANSFSLGHSLLHTLQTWLGLGAAAPMPEAIVEVAAEAAAAAITGAATAGGKTAVGGGGVGADAKGRGP